MSSVVRSLSKFPFLASICWQGESATVEGLSEAEILQLYERNWHYLGVMSDLGQEEKAILFNLAKRHHSWLVTELEVRSAVQFRYPIHNYILKVLSAVNHTFFEECSIFFGGRTMLALGYGEYRLSQDIDFLCPYGEAFSRLRRSVHDGGYEKLFDLTQSEGIRFPGEINANQYGVRFAVECEETVLKFEIVAEGRIALSSPTYPEWSPVACLSLVDQIAEKLLANGDRWPDSAVYSRDLIDLAVLKQKTSFPEEALVKAEAAYPTVEPLKRSILAFQDRPEYRQRCYERLQINSPAAIVDGLDALAMQVGLSPFYRQISEFDSELSSEE